MAIRNKPKEALKVPKVKEAKSIEELVGVEPEEDSQTTSSSVENPSSTAKPSTYRVTVSLPKDVYARLLFGARFIEERRISEIMTEAIEKYMDENKAYEADYLSSEAIK